MKQAAAKTTHSASGDPHLGVGGVALAFLDTAWRIAVPVLIFASAGIYADIHLQTKPWLTLLGTVIGFGVAGWLVKKQLDAVAKEDQK